MLFRPVRLSQDYQARRSDVFVCVLLRFGFRVEGLGFRVWGPGA